MIYSKNCELGIDFIAFDSEMGENSVVPVPPRKCQESSGQESIKLSSWFLIGDPGHGFCFSFGETSLDIVGGCVCNEECEDLIHSII